MICGSINDIHLYRGFTRGLDVLIDWLEANDPASLERGSHPIDGERVFANVMEPITRPEAEAHYETHRKYCDLQIDVRGREAYKVAIGQTAPVEPFDEENDFELVDAEQAVAGDLDRGCFAVFVPGEPHMPTLEFPGDGPKPVKKICFKLLADEYWG